MNDSLWEDAVMKLAAQLMGEPGGFPAEKIHPCPVFGNSLIIHAGHYQRSAERLIGITIECAVCGDAVAIDGVDET